MIDTGLLLAGGALNALAAHIAVVDASGVIVFVNEAWSRFARKNGEAGHAAGTCIGTNYLAVCQEAVRRGDTSARFALSGIEEVLRGNRDQFALEYPCHAPDRERWFRMSVTSFAAGSLPYLVIAHEEITSRKQAERGLQDSATLLRLVLDALPIGVWVINAEGRIVQGNAAGVRIWGGARYVDPRGFGQYKAWWLSTGAPVGAEEWAALRAIRTGESSFDEEIEIECFDKTHKIILNSAVPLYDSERRITGAIVVNQDITARKRAEVEREGILHEHDRLRNAALEANRLKDDFIATLSHELRTPLQSVLGWTAILQRSLADQETSGRAAMAIERNARIQAQLLEDALDVSRILRGKLTLNETDVNLAALIAEVLETMNPAATEKGIAIVGQVSSAPARVHGDPTRLQQILWNLLANALKFTPEGGRIEVSTHVGDEWVEVSVRDSGVGIAPEFMPFLFDRFCQGTDPAVCTPPGLGLGLAIVKELVDLHHGTITADSPGDGRGATFTVRLPPAKPSG